MLRYKGADTNQKKIYLTSVYEVHPEVKIRPKDADGNDMEDGWIAKWYQFNNTFTNSMQYKTHKQDPFSVDNLPTIDLENLHDFQKYSSHLTSYLHVDTGVHNVTGEHFSSLIYGTFLIQKSGLYTFGMKVNDGAILMVDDQHLIDHWVIQDQVHLQY